MNSKVKLLATALAALSLSACGSFAASEPEPTPTPIPDSYILPSGCILSEDAMADSLKQYVEYCNDAIKEKGLKMVFFQGSDGFVTIDAEPLDGTNAEHIDNIVYFDTVEQMFAHLYNNGQIDINGNMLVSAVPDVLEKMDEVRAQAVDELAEMQGKSPDEVISR